MKKRLSSCGLNQTRMRASMPAAAAGADGRRGRSSSCAYSPISAGRIAERDGRRVRVGAVGDDLQRDRPPGLERRAVAGGNRQRQPRRARARRYGSISRDGRDRVDTVKFGEASKRATSSRLAADRSPSATTHRHVLDVGRRRVAEHRQLEDRRDDDEAEEPRVHGAARGTPSSTRQRRRCISALSRARRSDASASIASA